MTEHMKLLASPDGYRPARCPTCGGWSLHVHDYRTRILLLFHSNETAELVPIIRHACQNAECQARWQTLPAFIARHLWRGWSTVEAATMGDAAPAERRAVPKRTVQRWGARLAAAALYLVQLFAVEPGTACESLAKGLGFAATRRELVAAYAVADAAPRGERLGRVAGLVDRLRRRARLM